MGMRNLIVLDTETTGVQRYDRIVSLAAIKAAIGSDDAEILYRCFDPRKDSHPEAAKIHGWDNWTTRFQDLFADHAHELHAWFSDGDVLVMHNAEFDLHFVNREFRKCGLPPLAAPAYCTLQKARGVWQGNASLEICAKRLGLQRATNKHHPVEDAFFTWNLYRHFNGIPTLTARQTWPEPVNLRPPEPRPAGDLPRRQVKRSGSAGLRWTASQRKQVENLARPVAVLLVFLALADSHFAAQEKAVVWELVRLASDRLLFSTSRVDVEVIATELLELEPTANLVARAMKAVLGDAVWCQQLPKLMTTMVMADGIFVEDERAALALIKDILVKQRSLAEPW